AGNDRACVAHALAGRRGLSGDEGGNRLVLHILSDPAGGLLFALAADLADEKDGAGARIARESFQTVDKVEALDRIAADSDRGRLAQAEAGQLVDRFIGQGPRTGDHADLAGFMDVAGHDADLALPGRDDPRTVGADQHHLAAHEEAPDAHHIENWNALRDAD